MFNALKQKADRLIKDTSGATAIEYGLIASLIFLVIVVTVQNISSKNEEHYTSLSKAIQKATN